MELHKVKSLFPSEDGNLQQQEQLLKLIEKLVSTMDSYKDPNKTSLGAMKEQGSHFYKEMVEQSEIPSSGEPLSEVVDDLLEMVKGHPYQTRKYATNAIPMASIPGLLGMLTTTLVNSNSLWDVYSPIGAEAEVKVASMMANLVGYNPKKSLGYTTWGGQGAVFTSLRLAIAKQFPNAKEKGLPQNLYCFASPGAHYSLLKSVEATGIGSNQLISVNTKKDHTMDEEDLKRKMIEVINKGGVPLYIAATTGTTDSFAIDHVKAIKETADEVTNQYELNRVFIHADSAMGGFYSFFNEYDYDNNPLSFSGEMLNELLTIKARMQHLHMADSVCFDFHKLGQTPYVSSLFLAKEGKDLSLLDLKEFDTPYVGNRGYGSYHTGYTLECSRMASSISMYATLLAFGTEGYQKLLAKYVELNLYFRQLIEKKIPQAAIVNQENPGPITLFRIYPSDVMWEKESHGESTIDEILKVNQLNDQLFESLGKDREQVFLGDTKKVCLVKAADHHEHVPIYAGKFFSISPYTQLEDVEEMVDFIERHIKKIVGGKDLAVQY
nr:pyridoxal-dependent decarboxylase [Evansella halocellulosilytica]